MIYTLRLDALLRLCAYPYLSRVGGSGPLPNEEDAMGNGQTTTSAWTFSCGDKGKNRVRVFERPDRDGLWIHVYGQRVTKLEHTDRERAKREAKEQSRRIGSGGSAAGNVGAVGSGITLRSLTNAYLEKKTPLKESVGQQRYDQRTIPLLLRVFAPDLPAAELDVTDWQNFIKLRRAGVVYHGTRKGQKVRNRIIAQDLKLLLAVLNWGTMVRDKSTGKYLLDRNPLRLLKLPNEEDPHRPRVSVEQFRALRLVAAELSPAAELFVVVMYYTGHRSASVRQLVWGDIDFHGKKIRWRGAVDKSKWQHATPIHKDALAVLRREFDRVGGEGSRPLFPSPTDSWACMSRDHAHDLFKTLAARAELPEGQRFGWHAFRRTFANTLHRRGVPLQDLKDLGGWKTAKTLTECYLQPDEGAQRDALVKLTG